MKGNKFVPFLIVSLGLTAFLAGYVMVGRGLDPNTESQTGTILDKFGSPQPEAIETQQLDEIKVFPLSSVKMVSVSNSSDRKGVTYFEKNSGKLFEFNFEDGKERVVSDTVLSNFLSSAWSPVKREVLSLFYSPSGTKIKYHNYDTGKTTALNTSIRSAAFSPDGGLIAYYIPGTASSSEPGQAGKIYIAQPNGTYPKKILDTRITDLSISWPIKDRVSFATPENGIFLLTEAGGLTKFMEPKINLDTKWSVSGNKVLFSWGKESTDHQLWLKDVESKSERDIGIPTLASKCVWSIDNTTAFCAIPKTPSVDEVYKIDTLTGTKELIAEPEMPVKSLFLTALEKYILITNTADEKLYGVSIEP